MRLGLAGKVSRITMSIGLAVLLVGVAAACATPAVTPPPATPTPPPSAASSAAAQPSPAGTSTGEITGTWTRLQSCEEQLAAFKAAGLDDQAGTMVVGNWVGENETRAPGYECAGARAPEEHSHFFTTTGMFGSIDANGVQVDDGDYVLVDGDTLAFPSHSQEFGYAGQILVDFAFIEGRATFRVVLPASCADACRVAYGWAMSAFFGSKEWIRRS
jgi:hypothetical protein